MAQSKLPNAKAALRTATADAIERFLAAGGNIKQCRPCKSLPTGRDRPRRFAIFAAGPIAKGLAAAAKEGVSNAITSKGGDERLFFFAFEYGGTVFGGKTTPSVDKKGPVLKVTINPLPGVSNPPPAITEAEQADSQRKADEGAATQRLAA